MSAKSPLAYLKQELNFTMAEWNALTDQDKTDLKAWAEEEMVVLGVKDAA